MRFLFVHFVNDRQGRKAWGFKVEADRPDPVDFYGARMATCPKCGTRVKRVRKATGLKECRRHGPIENYVARAPKVKSTLATEIGHV